MFEQRMGFALWCARGDMVSAAKANERYPEEQETGKVLQGKRALRMVANLIKRGY